MPANQGHSNTTCDCCVEKGPPPTAPSLDSFFVAVEIPFSVVASPCFIDPSQLHATEVAGRWDVPPPTDLPARPRGAIERCSIFELWLI